MNNRFSNFTQQELEVLEVALLALNTDDKTTIAPQHAEAVGQVRSKLHSEINVNQTAPNTMDGSHFCADRKW